MADTILIIGGASIGDTTVALPCFHAIEKKYRSSRRVLLTRTKENAKFSSPLDVLGKDTGFIDDVIEFDFGSWTIGKILKLKRQLDAQRVRLAIFMYFGGDQTFYVWRQMAFLRMCGMREFVGLPSSSSLFQNQFDPETGRYEHQAEFLARRLSEIGPVPLGQRANWDLRLNARESQVAEDILAPLGNRQFFVLHMGTKSASRDWGEANWLALRDRLAGEYGGVGLVTVGAPFEGERADKVLSGWRGPVVNACGKGSVRESAALISHACLFIGHDSGPGHLAAAVGLPIVSLQPSVDLLGKWDPYGANVTVLRPSGAIETIEVDAVMKAVRKYASSAVRFAGAN